LIGATDGDAAHADEEELEPLPKDSGRKQVRDRDWWQSTRRQLNSSELVRV